MAFFFAKRYPSLDKVKPAPQPKTRLSKDCFLDFSFFAPMRVPSRQKKRAIRRMSSHTVGIEPTLQSKYSSWHTLWKFLVHRSDPYTRLKHPCMHILPYYPCFFVEKKLRTCVFFAHSQLFCFIRRILIRFLKE